MADPESGRLRKSNRQKKQPDLYNPAFFAKSHSMEKKIRTKKLKDLSNDLSTNTPPFKVQSNIKKHVIVNQKTHGDANGEVNSDDSTKENEIKVSKNEKASQAQRYILVVPEVFDTDKLAIEQPHRADILYATELLEKCLTDETTLSDVVGQLGSIVVRKLESDCNDSIRSIFEKAKNTVKRVILNQLKFSVYEKDATTLVKALRWPSKEEMLPLVKEYMIPFLKSWMSDISESSQKEYDEKEDLIFSSIMAKFRDEAEEEDAASDEDYEHTLHDKRENCRRLEKEKIR